MTTEAIYDAKITPLLVKIARLAEQHSIPFVATFQLGQGLYATSHYLTPDCATRLLAAKRILLPPDEEQTTPPVEPMGTSFQGEW